jgi:hypothetical protein
MNSAPASTETKSDMRRNVATGFGIRVRVDAASYEVQMTSIYSKKSQLVHVQTDIAPGCASACRQQRQNST